MLPRSSVDQHLLMTVVLLLVGGAALARGGALIHAQMIDHQGPSPESIAALTDALMANSSNLPQRLADAGVSQVDRLRFDESAAVILTSGADAQPGQADVDDNLDQIVDNAAEIGAVGSDDQCLAPWQPGYASASQAQATVTISRGTYLADDGEFGRVNDTRFLLHGQSGDSTWTWMIVP